MRHRRRDNCRWQRADRSRLERMADALAHRGPDGSGMHVSGAVGLVHRRLAIIDLETGDQPLFSGGEGEEPLALVANGEIYNYRELAAEMPGVRLRTGSDCEPPLHLYRREGIEGFDRLRGMYAIALVDPAACPGGRLVLVRDPFGIKPLYYVEDESGFAFASGACRPCRGRLCESGGKRQGDCGDSAASVLDGRGNTIFRHSPCRARRDTGDRGRPHH